MPRVNTQLRIRIRYWVCLAHSWFYYSSGPPHQFFGIFPARAYPTRFFGDMLQHPAGALSRRKHPAPYDFHEHGIRDFTNPFELRHTTGRMFRNAPSNSVHETDVTIPAGDRLGAQWTMRRNVCSLSHIGNRSANREINPANATEFCEQDLERPTLISKR